jgi:hypothetical protein
MFAATSNCFVLEERTPFKCSRETSHYAPSNTRFFSNQFKKIEADSVQNTKIRRHGTPHQPPHPSYSYVLPRTPLGICHPNIRKNSNTKNHNTTSHVPVLPMYAQSLACRSLGLRPALPLLCFSHSIIARFKTASTSRRTHRMRTSFQHQQMHQPGVPL